MELLRARRPSDVRMDRDRWRGGHPLAPDRRPRDLRSGPGPAGGDIGRTRRPRIHRTVEVPSRVRSTGSERTTPRGGPPDNLSPAPCTPWRTPSPVSGRRPTPTSVNSWGSRCVRQSWNSAGMTLRLARSPVAPNSTKAAGSGTRSRRSPSRRGFSRVLVAGARFRVSVARRMSRIVRGASFFAGAGAAGAGVAGALAAAAATRRDAIPSPSSPRDRRTRCGARRAPLRRRNRPAGTGIGSAARA